MDIEVERKLEDISLGKFSLRPDRNRRLGIPDSYPITIKEAIRFVAMELRMTRARLEKLERK